MLPLLVTGAALVGGLLITSAWLRQRRARVWRRFAAAHGLAVQNGDGPPIVQGMIDGRRFDLHAESRGSDSGALGVEEVRMTLHLRRALTQLRLEPAAGIPEGMSELLVPDRIPVGDEPFDRRILVRGEAPEIVERELTPERRRALLRLFEGRNVECVDGELAIVDRTMLSRADRLESHLLALRIAADEIEGTPAEAAGR